MAAFTTFSDSALARYLVMFDIGELRDFRAVETGIENSNYFVTLKRGDALQEFVLTITEGLGFDEMPFFNELLGTLSAAALPVPVPMRTLDGMASTVFCGKPTWLFPRLAGAHPVQVNAAQCAAVGDALARLHEAAASARYKRANPYDAAWARATLDGRQKELSATDLALISAIADEYALLEGNDGMPRGIIHGDLFRDNALFEEDKLTGIIDFYHACEDFLVQDVAITLNEWCTDAAGDIDPVRYDAMLGAYESVRKLTDEERERLPAFRRAGAMRFVLTRLISGGEQDHLKDPEEFLRIARGARSAE